MSSPRRSSLTASPRTGRAIYLTGFSGSGKSTIGPRLASKLQARFFDTDVILERQQRMKISSIFDKLGEHKFRELERAVIAKIAVAKGSKVVSLGGGALLSPVNRQAVRASGGLVYLSCSVREIYRRLTRDNKRPLLSDYALTRQDQLDRIKSLLATRVIHYQLADLKVSTTNRTVAEVVKIIRQTIEN